jgi:hypothetical protein
MLTKLSVLSSGSSFSNSNYNYDNTNTNVSSHLSSVDSIDLAHMAKQDLIAKSAGNFIVKAIFN